MNELNIIISTQDGMLKLTDLNDPAKDVTLMNQDLLKMLAIVYAKYSDEIERAELIKEFIFKDKVAKYIFDKKLL